MAGSVRGCPLIMSRRRMTCWLRSWSRCGVSWRSWRRPGGQAGHEGSTLAQVAKPDREVRHEPGRCGRCGTGLAGRPVTGIERRQVFDLPPVKVKVTKHQLIERECRCGQREKGAAPAGAKAPVQYGPRIAGIIIYLLSAFAQLAA